MVRTPNRQRDTDREWRLVTVPYWQGSKALSGHVLLGEVPLQTDLPRSIDGVVIHRRGRGGVPPGPFYLHGGEVSASDRQFWLGEISGARVTVIQTKVEPVGFSVLGQTLVSTVLLPERYPGSRPTGIALGAAGNPDIERVLPHVSRDLQVAEWPTEGAASRPKREYKASPDFLTALDAQFPRLARVSEPIRLTSFEGPEALYVSGNPAVHTPAELRDRDVVVVHTIAKATNLPVVGHAVFTAALIREQKPRSLRSLILSARRDSIVEGVAAQFDVETFTAAEIQKIVLGSGR
jgi:hypothetical protein